ncbi:formamidopyrimidine-DNA glycosylase [Candidatus Falkowbacteria bacterium HGW-Falkowbacteria-2]|uniref:Formamidopyrimidine-DNA glycosylase n=1 Tax=Candidatus Falkowbacteria bacterium HGW-Falkowbacteria-2 TaxID=2013769 RepID=A0A2N2E1M2_9BACT|nr:MAG: formamidopyrimidine-DNA glycosylase [Candidatus Falkowbacteria bacterium HGW-Falkowbacteria-2]
MPELPEVETVRRDLESYLVGAIFTDSKFIDFKNVAPEATFLARFLKKAKVLALRRKGKLLIFDLDTAGKKDKHLLIHLKMTGQLVYAIGKQTKAGGHSLSEVDLEMAVGGDLPNKYTRAIFSFDSGGKLYFNDLRKFGYIKLVASEELEKILATSYGPEPIESSFTIAWLTSILAKRTAPVKAVILNQKLIAGLGNIYADEALFMAQINPSVKANKLKAAQIKALHDAIVKVITRAIKERGTTFRNYVDAKGKKGNFIKYLQVYQRQKQPCLRCGTTILKVKVAGRGTHYCPSCQK